ncbi:MAG: hypothetical protein OHK0050_18960 [Roseiflexaceae bacterium]
MGRPGSTHTDAAEPQRIGRGCLIGSSVTLLIGMIFAVVWVQLSHQQRYIEARLRWQESAPPHYRLQVTSAPACTIEVEVRNEQPIQILRQDACLHPARNVTELFALIDRGKITEMCFFAGCACRVDVNTYGTYDATYGYPTEISMRYDRAANWWTKGFWVYLIERGHTPGCARSSESSLIERATLIPLN